jgi:addiction module RelE/StbE family toxin
MIMEIDYLPKFARQYKKLPVAIRKKAKDKIELFRINPNDPRLRVHKLNGALGDYLSFTVDYNYRIIFKYVESKLARFYDIGDHEIY